MGGAMPPVAGNRQAGFRAALPAGTRTIVPTAGISEGKRLCPHVQAAGQHEKGEVYGTQRGGFEPARRH